MITVQDCLQDISDFVVCGVGEELKSQYMERLSFLYAIPIASLMYSREGEQLLSIFLNEAKEYEKRYFEKSLLYIDDFVETSLENVIGIFSIISNQLAVSRLLDMPYPLLSYVMSECYNGFLEEISEIEKDDGYVLLVSETTLDFMYASCMSDDKSLRLMKYN